VCTEVAQLARAAARPQRLADGTAMLDQVDVQAMAQVRRDEVGEEALQLLVVQPVQRQAQLRQHPDGVVPAQAVRQGRHHP